MIGRDTVTASIENSHLYRAAEIISTTSNAATRCWQRVEPTHTSVHGSASELRQSLSQRKAALEHDSDDRSTAKGRW